MSVKIVVELYGFPHAAGPELDRLADGPGAGTIASMEGALHGSTAVTQARAHVITGKLKGSIHSDSNFDGDMWEGTISAVRNPGIFELARGNSPTYNHPEGGHYFFDPGGPVFEKAVRYAVWEWVTGGEGGPAPSGDLGPWSGG